MNLLTAKDTKKRIQCICQSNLFKLVIGADINATVKKKTLTVTGLVLEEIMMIPQPMRMGYNF